MKRLERVHSPDQRRAELNVSKRKKDRDRRGDYDRFSPTKRRYRKGSPKKSDHSPPQRKQEKEPERSRCHGQVTKEPCRRTGCSKETSSKNEASSLKADHSQEEFGTSEGGMPLELVDKGVSFLRSSYFFL